jgi:hypothetical protein
VAAMMVLVVGPWWHDGVGGFFFEFLFQRSKSEKLKTPQFAV